MENDRTYFTKREAEEREAATRSKGKAREAHEQMAQRYRELAANSGERASLQPALASRRTEDPV